MKNVFIVGEGELGKAIGKEFSKHKQTYNVIGVNRTHLGRRMDEGDFLDSVEQIIKNYLPQIIINCIGHFEYTNTDGLHSSKQFDRLFVPNVKLAWSISQIYYNHMSSDVDWRYFVNIGSESSFLPHTDSALYCASKAALLMLTKNLSRDWYSKKICVFQVDPGIILDTKMGSSDNFKELGGAYKNHTYVKKETVAKFVCNLVDLGPYTSGHSYPIGTVIR